MDSIGEVTSIYNLMYKSPCMYHYPIQAIFWHRTLMTWTHPRWGESVVLWHFATTKYINQKPIVQEFSKSIYSICGFGVPHLWCKLLSNCPKKSIFHQTNKNCHFWIIFLQKCGIIGTVLGMSQISIPLLVFCRIFFV